MKKKLAPGITIDQNVRFGKPVIVGTRVPVDLVVGKIAGGETITKVAREYDLTKKQIYAADVVSSEDVALA